LHDGGRYEREVSNAVAAFDGAVDAVTVGSVVSKLAQDSEEASPEETAAIERDVFFVDLF